MEKSLGDAGWTEDDHLRQMRSRNCIPRVADTGDRVVGVLLYSLHAEYIVIERLLVDPKYRRQGVALSLLQKPQQNHRGYVKCEVPEEHLDVQCLLRKAGFRAVSVFGNTYLFVWEGHDGRLRQLEATDARSF